MAAAALLIMQALCAGGQPEYAIGSAPCECDRGEDRAWPQRCDTPFAQRCPCTAGGWSVNVGPTFVVLLNSFEKLTWATVGLGRLLMMANSSGTVSLVEPCVADSEIGGFGHRDWLQLDTYFDTERLRSTLRPGSLVTVGQYVGAMRSSRRAAAAEPATQRAVVVDAARSLDVLVVFVWWEKERQDLAFRPPLGLIDCRARLLAKGHLRQAPGVGWFEVDKMREGTDNRTIDAPGMRFRRVLCADPYYLDACPAHVAPVDAEQPPVLEGLEGLVHVSRAQWLSLLDRHLRALDGMQRVTEHQDSGREPRGEGLRGSPDERVGQGADEAVLSVALASYRRTALADVGQGEERWGRWVEDAWMAKQVALPPGVATSVDLVLQRYLPGPFLSVHFRAGRILNRGTIDGGEGIHGSNRFRRIPYEGRDLEAVLAYPGECARSIVAQARQRMAALGLQYVFLATDLVEGMMPELDATNPATTPPLMSPDVRAVLVDNVEEAWHFLREHLNPVVLSSHLLHAEASGDTEVNVVQALADKGLAAIIDRELLARGQEFLYAGQYAGRCEATGYSEGVRERRRELGAAAESSLFVSDCCILDSPQAYVPTGLPPEAYLAPV